MKVKTIQEFLLEQSQAKKGDWTGSNSMLGELSVSVMDLFYKKIDDINIDSNKYILLQNTNIKDKLNYVLGYYEEQDKETKLGNIKETKFVIDFGITFNSYKKSKIYGTLYTVVGVASKNKVKGLATFMYKYFVKKMKFTILGDNEQYFGARMLWKKLSNDIDVIVDIYDIKEDKILEQNVILHHGNYNNDFDARLWSFSKDKHFIHSVLIDIK